jgi:hypothetical protein
VKVAEDYPNSGTTRWIVRNLARGETVVLDDGSKWRVGPTSRDVAGSWPKTTHVTVRRLETGEYVLGANERSVRAVYCGFDALGREDDADE